MEDSLNVRSAASTGGDVLGQVEDGEKLALLSDTPQNGWDNVQYTARRSTLRSIGKPT